METSNQPKPRASLNGWLVLLLAVASGFAAAYVPFALIVAPALWAYAGARTKPALIALPAAAFAAIMFTYDSVLVAAGLSGAALLAAVLVYALLTHRFGNTDTVLILCGVFLIGLYTAICMPGVLDGRGAFADVQAAILSMKEFYTSIAAGMPQLGEGGTALVSEMMDAMYEAVPTSFVAVLCIIASILGLGNLLFFRAFCKKQEQIQLSRMRPFRDWAMTRSMMYGLFLMLILSLILELSDWTYAASFSTTANALLAIPLFLQGISVIDFFIVRGQKNVSVIRTLTYVGICVLYQLVFVPLVLVGCFDQVFRLRERMRGVPPRTA